MIESKWEPVNFITPPSWYRFWGRRIRGLPIGIGAALSYRAFYIGIEIFTNDTRGLGLGLGPFWIGFAYLKEPPHD